MSDDALFAVVVLIAGAVFTVWTGLHLLFLNSLMKALDVCSPENRTMHPWLVWLNILPLWNFVWQFWTVIQVSRSLRQEYRARRIPSGDQTFGLIIGLATCFVGILCIGSLITGQLVQEVAGSKESGIPFGILWMLSGPAQFVLMIVYWVKVVRLARPLKE